MTFEIEYEAKLKLRLPYEKIIKDVVIAALDYEECPYESQVSVTLTDNATIAQINEEFRGIASATDVLSFPFVDYEEPGEFDWLEDDDVDGEYFDPDSGELVLGDIVISVEKVLEQAEKYGHSPKRELAFLVAHSMLHLMGYDHMEEEERLVMEKKQEEILQSLGITR